MAYQSERRRTWAVYILFFLALIAAVLAFVDAGRYMGWLPIQATIPGLGEISFVSPNASWFGAVMAGLLGIIWLLVAFWIWTLNPSGWLFVVFFSAVTLIFQVLAILGRTTFAQVLPAVAVNGLALLLALLPSTRDAFTPRRPAAAGAQIDREAAEAAAAAVAAAHVPEASPAIEDAEMEEMIEAAETDAPPIDDVTPSSTATARGALSGSGDLPPAEDMDLTMIEGIGPKIAAALEEAGINSIYKLSAVSIEELRAILKDAGLSADPSTWSRQAQMAADGDLIALQVYQNALVGGREV